MLRMRWAAWGCLLLLIGGCALSPGARPFNVKNLAKSDTDLVADAYVTEVNRLSRELTIKLYQRNPRELRTGPPGMTLERRLSQLFDPPRRLAHPELEYRYGIDAVPLAFDPDYEGDRVFALMAGITGMLSASYNYKDEFFLLDGLDQQKLYDSARNLEIIVWRLSNRRDADGELLLLSNGVSEEGILNLSFERLFGKLIGHQDMMARIIADRTNRTINRAVYSVATTALIPI